MNIKNSLRSLLIAGLVCLGVLDLKAANFAFAEEITQTILNEYWVRIPATSLTCQEEAGVLAKRFANATRFTVKSSVCRGVIDSRINGERIRLYSLLLAYESTGKPSLYRAPIGGSTKQWSSESGMSGYTKYSDCLEQIPLQSDLFVWNTGLTVVAAYCEPVHVLSSTNYTLNIEGFGDPKATLGSFSFNAYQPLDGADSALFQDAVITRSRT